MALSTATAPSSPPSPCESFRTRSVATPGSLCTQFRLGWDNQLVTLPFGESFHKQRKFIQRELSHSECLAFRPIQLEQTRVLLKDLLRDPGNFELLLRK